MDIKTKEKQLIQKIERTRHRLDQLRRKRKLEIANLACRYRLEHLESSLLENAFKKISEEFKL